MTRTPKTSRWAAELGPELTEHLNRRLEAVAPGRSPRLRAKLRAQEPPVLPEGREWISPAEYEFIEGIGNALTVWESGEPGSLRRNDELTAAMPAEVYICETDGGPVPVFAVANCYLVRAGANEADDRTGFLDKHAAGSTAVGVVGEGSGWELRQATVGIGEVIAAAEGGAPVFPNLLYFFRPHVTFHPGALPTGPHSSALAGTLKQNQKPTTVLTIDTGPCRARTDTHPSQGQYVEDHAQGDPFDPKEVVRGHGPAIADYIGRLIGSAKDSVLTTIRHESSAASMAAGTGKAVYTTIATPVDNQVLDIRCFDTCSLLATLHGLQLDKLGVDVVNMSFGTLGCPNLMEFDPVADWIHSHPQIQFAVAAGNHGSDMPSWPAAFSSHNEAKTKLASTDSVFKRNARRTLANVISVGALELSADNACTLSGLTAFGPAVDVYAEGIRIPVEHPTKGVAEWSGTSFAAPFVAALLALGVSMADLKADDDDWVVRNEY